MCDRTLYAISMVKSQCIFLSSSDLKGLLENKYFIRPNIPFANIQGNYFDLYQNNWAFLKPANLCMSLQKDINNSINQAVMYVNDLFGSNCL